MDDKKDRRHIEPLLRDHFPDMVGSSSAEWAAFLNHLTGINTSADEDNATAFDAWRKALAVMGYEGVWTITPAQEAEIKARVIEKAEAAKKWRADQAEATKVELARLATLGLNPLPAPE